MNALIGTPSGFSQSGSIDGHCCAGAVKRAFGCAAFAPVAFAISGVQSLPCQSISMRGRLVGHAFPPHVAVGRQRDVGEDRVLRERRHRVRIGLVAGAGRDAEEARLRIDRVQPAVRVRA